MSIEKINSPVLVVSKNFFNQTEQIIGCPVLPRASEDPLHIYVSMKDLSGIVLCEQMKLLDLRSRGFKKTAELKVEDTMNIADAIQSIFDYYPYGR